MPVAAAAAYSTVGVAAAGPAPATTIPAASTPAPAEAVTQIAAWRSTARITKAPHSAGQAKSPRRVTRGRPGSARNPGGSMRGNLE